MRRNSPRTLRFRIVASGVMLVLTLGLLEAAARTLAPSVPIWRAPDNVGVIMTANETRLWGMGPGTRRNVSTTATINELGLRGPVPKVPRPEGRQRVLLVGDSSFFGHGIQEEETITVRLEADLRAAGIDADVVNGAIPGYSTEQTRILLDELGWGFEPTLLLIANLWSDNNADGFRDADLLRTAHLYHHNPLASSALFQVAAGWVDRARGGEGAHLVTWTRDSTWPEGGTRRVPLQDYARNLDAMVRDGRARGCGVAFIAPVNQGLADGGYALGAGWDPYFTAQASVAAWHGVPVISALAAIKADPAPTADKFVDLMHPSALGAADIAREIDTTLRAAGWPQSQLLGRAEPFDASGLVDDARVGAGSQPSLYSPQAQLFPIANDPVPAGTLDPDHHEPGTAAWQGRPGGEPPASRPAGVTETSSRSGTNAWVLAGTALGGTAPLQVNVRAPDGRAIGFARLGEPGPFTLQVRGDLPSVKVSVTDATGATTETEATAGGPAVRLQLP